MKPMISGILSQLQQRMPVKRRTLPSGPIKPPQNFGGFGMPTRTPPAIADYYSYGALPTMRIHAAPPPRMGIPTVPRPVMGVRRGGPLSALAARFVRGPGTGRADAIPARLSNGEYVLDAETVALLGDGSSDAGARRLDEMRRHIRRHKGKTLAKGKFSPDAKQPMSYLKKK